MSYTLDPGEVKKVIDNKLSGKPFDKEQFMYYHLHRNHFNVKSEVKSLKHIEGSKFRDNFGFIWEEQSMIKNFFHMPKGNWAGSVMGLSKPYSRKFLRDDTVSGIGGEFEMIIRFDGKRIDALTHGDYQETYNFGKTRNTSEHYALDVEPHRENPNYTFNKNTGSVMIIEQT